MIKAIGVGDNVVDRYINKKIMFPGGNAVNFSVYAKKCGADAAYLGVIGDDKEGKLVYDSLTELGVELKEASFVPGVATERCDVVLKDGDRVFVDCTYGQGRQETLKLTPAHMEYLKGFHIVHSSCYSYMEDQMEKVGTLPGFKTFDFSSEAEFRGDNYLKKICPYIDMALFSGEDMSREEEVALREKVLALGASYVMVTRGTQGQILWDGKKEHKGVVKLITPIDTMGAGDSFFTSFVVSLFQNGFSKGKGMTDEMIDKSFEFAAGFSAENCLTEGAFGFATQYE